MSLSFKDFDLEEKENKFNFFDENFIFLGIKGENFYLWNEDLQQLNSFTFKEATNKSMLESVFGFSNLCNKFPKMNKSGSIFDYNVNDVAEYMRSKCKEKGLFDEKKIMGSGVFINPKNKKSLIINSFDIWSTDNSFDNKRIQSNTIFEKSKDLGITKNQKVADYNDIYKTLELLESFKFKRGQQDAVLLLGWLLHCYILGALNWRTHCSLTGPKGSGKSTLMSLLTELLKFNSINCDGDSSEAGIRQACGKNALAVLIDEGEADSNKICRILQLLRGASSGSTVYRGTSDQKSLSFDLKVAGLVGGIVPPKLNGADSSRFLRLNIEPKEIEDLRNSEVMNYLFDSEKLNELGLKLFKYTIDNFNEIMEIVKKVKSIISVKADSRFSDTYGTIISCSYFALKSLEDGFNTEEHINNFINLFNFDNELQQNDFKDEEECLDLIMTSTINLSNNEKSSIIDLVKNMFKTKGLNKESYDLSNKELQKNGVRFDTNEFTLNIEYSNHNLLKVLKETRFGNGDLKFVLLRLKDSELNNNAVQINGIQKSKGKVVKIRLDRNKYLFND